VGSVDGNLIGLLLPSLLAPEDHCELGLFDCYLLSCFDVDEYIVVEVPINVFILR
jgi:hypothetical protein